MSTTQKKVSSTRPPLAKTKRGGKKPASANQRSAAARSKKRAVVAGSKKKPSVKIPARRPLIIGAKKTTASKIPALKVARPIAKTPSLVTRLNEAAKALKQSSVELVDSMKSNQTLIKELADANRAIRTFEKDNGNLTTSLHITAESLKLIAEQRNDALNALAVKKVQVADLSEELDAVTEQNQDSDAPDPSMTKKAFVSLEGKKGTVIAETLTEEQGKEFVAFMSKLIPGFKEQLPPELEIH